MSRKTVVILALVLVLAGIGVMIYPALSDYISRVNGSYAIQELDERMGNFHREKLTEQRALAEDYNARLSGDIADAGEIPEEYEQILDFGNGIMGYIRIPQIEVNLPIYHGISDEVLAKGVGHLPETSFPIGGAGNHSVLSGHTGLPGAELFTDLTELQTGDRFYITVLEETLAYQVDQILVVLPGESEPLAPVPGEDHCTLVTCTPYGINSHRLLVRGIRVEAVPDEVARQLGEEGGKPGFPPVLIGGAVAVLAILGCIVAVIFKKTK